MKSIFELLDYLFYRVFCYYSKRKDPDPKIRGGMVLLFIGGMSFLSVLAIVEIIFRIEHPNVKPFLSIYVVIMPLALWQRYKGDYIIKLTDRYNNEKLPKKEGRGWCIVLYLLLVLLIPLLVGTLRHNFGWRI